MKLADTLRVGLGVARAMRSQYWSAARIAAWQERALVRMMRHAARNVPFYRALGIDADSLHSAADLVRFPVLRKADVQQAGRALLADGYDPATLHTSRTSGSSGEPTTTWFDDAAWLQTKYVLKLRRLIATSGVAPGQRVLIVSEARPEELREQQDAGPGGGGLYRQRRVSIHTPFEQHLALLRAWRPTALYAYPSYLAELLDAAASDGLGLPVIPVIFTSSEVLTPGLRARVERAFRGRVCDIYGSTEFKEVAWQCAAARYHLNFESVWLEPLAEDEPGPVVLSTLVNRAMPLLRYRLGDEARAQRGRCECGRHSTTLHSFAGREADTIVLPGGRKLSPYLLTTAIEHDAALIQYRIVEAAPGSFRVEIVSRETRPVERDAALCRALQEIAGDGARFDVLRVPRLARAPSGKRSVFQREWSGA